MRSRRIALATGLTYNALEWDGPGDLTFVLVHGFADIAHWRPVETAARGHVIGICAARRHRLDRPRRLLHFDYVVDLDEVIACRAQSRPARRPFDGRQHLELLGRYRDAAAGPRCSKGSVHPASEASGRPDERLDRVVARVAQQAEGLAERR
jgi:hypothetical protein